MCSPSTLSLKRPVEQMSFATQYFKPHIYLEPSVVQHDFLTVRFQEPAPKLSEHDEVLAYANPAERADNPVIWIPRDPWGLADEELRKLQEQGLNAHTRAPGLTLMRRRRSSTLNTALSTRCPSGPLLLPTKWVLSRTNFLSLSSFFDLISFVWFFFVLKMFIYRAVLVPL